MKNKLKLIGILLLFGVLFDSCITNKTEADFVSDLTVIAKGVSEGINLYIDNIPKEALFLSVSLYDITTDDQLYTGTHFSGDELEQLKKAGFLVCPFVKNGHEYEITVASLKTEEKYMQIINSCTITAVAGGGVHMINNPILVWDKNNNIATLSVKPIFSDEKINFQNTGFIYGLTFRNEETGGAVSADEPTNELVYDNTQNHNSVVEMIGNIGLNKNIQIYADVGLTLEYKKAKWMVIFAKTEETVISL
jgi:hypothetical protein